MAFPIKVCVVCEEEFELKPNHAGYANRCISCNESGDSPTTPSKTRMDADERQSQAEANAARRDAMRNLLYRKDS